MRISELIRRLQSIESRYGNLLVVAHDTNVSKLTPLDRDSVAVNAHCDRVAVEVMLE